MRRKRLLWQLYISYLVILLFSILAAGLYAGQVMRTLYLDQSHAHLREQGLAARRVLTELLLTGRAGDVQEACQRFGREGSTRVTVILPDGRVIGDSQADPAEMENHGDRPEVRTALAGEPGKSTRPSDTMGKEMSYVALPVTSGDRVVAVVRTAVSLEAMQLARREVYVQIATGGLVIAAAAAALSLWASRRIRVPLEEMQEGAEAFARGELSHRLTVPDSEELAGLGRSMNVMAKQLDERIQDVTRQRNELETVLSGMVEAVLAVDMDERIMRFNRAAGDLFGVTSADMHGRSIQEAVRHPQLQRLVKQTLSGTQPIEEEITVEGDGPRYLEAHGTLLHDADGKPTGALVVLHDVTRLKKLENLRREFVANVSHELKTPITSIKGFVETMLDHPPADAEETRRFLEIIRRHSDRLNAIIEDLLSLSRVEQEAEREGIELAETNIRSVLAEAVQACQPQVREKGMTVKLHCAEDLRASAKPALLEQAVVNLIDNAVKYSEKGEEVEVAAEQTDDEVRIHVTDHGCGIEREHLPRLFERFYRVDKGRSRKLGGTGLGLAIVKHIVKAHHGQVTVQSTPGVGSAFTIHLPLN